MPIAVVAIGGNSLIRLGQRGTLEEQRQNLAATCEGIAAVALAGYQVAVTHGNGPQVGDALLRSELAAGQVEPLPLDVCVAETRASIGYLLQQTLQECFERHGLRRPVVTMVTQVLVSPRDGAFRNPTKPVCPFYNAEQAELRRTNLRWQMVEDPQRGYRRVVPSPKPKVIVELEAIRGTLANGTLVIACGGDGIPVVFRRDRLVGIDAVIDKDRVSSLLAWELEAELFVISTTVDQVALNFGTSTHSLLDWMNIDEARRYLRGGQTVIITSPEKIPEALQGMAGTRIAAAAVHSTQVSRQAA